LAGCKELTYHKEIALANHKSALKRARQSQTRRKLNGINKTKVKNALKKARAAITESPDSLNSFLGKAMSALHKASSKGTLHRKNAARRISRLSKLCSLTAPAKAPTTEAEAPISSDQIV
jgi:small subunit ribosomal protein S20